MGDQMKFSSNVQLQPKAIFYIKGFFIIIL